jgi:hemoglobin
MRARLTGSPRLTNDRRYDVSPPYPHKFKMKTAKSLAAACLSACLALAACSGPDTNSTASDNSKATHTAESEPAPSAVETIAAMVADCAASADARAARHNDKPLYERLGGHEKISEFVSKLIELHMKNEVVKPYFEGVDLETLGTHLVDFIGAGTGGGETYKGRSMPDSHAGMKITPEVFLSAGADIGVAMQAVGWGADEQGEFMCIILSMKESVLMQ